MNNREDSVLNLQVTLIPIMIQYWKIDQLRLSNLIDKYDLLDYIDICYEAFNSTGIQGVLNELEDYIKIQGGNIR